MLWLNGGPGCSSLIGCFYELGPWRVQDNGILQRNTGAWNRRCGILFLDNPLGTGFSFASSETEIPKDLQAVASHLQYALGYFLAMNPGFQSRPIFLAGESYAGKYVPALAYYVLENINSQSKCNLASRLAGIAIGNGLIHPHTQVQHHADVSYNFGLLDKEQSLVVHEMANEVVTYIDREEWFQAFETRTRLCNWIEETSGIATLLDVRRSSKYHHLTDGTDYLATFLNTSIVKEMLNVHPMSLDFVSCRQSIRLLMAEDTMKSSKWKLEAILKKEIPVLLYYGQFDAKDGVAGSEAWIRNLDWDHCDLFWKSNREIWKVNGEMAGTWRQYKNLTLVVNARAGHQVPADQPTYSQSMIETWIDASLKAWSL